MPLKYIFVSYTNVDKEYVEILIRIIKSMLSKHGIDVKHQGDLPIGRTFRLTVPEMVKKAYKVIVVWSNASVRDDRVYVHEEAAMAVEQEKYIPLIVGSNLRPSQLPLGFRSYSTDRLPSDLSNTALVERVLTKVLGLHVEGGAKKTYSLPKSTAVTGLESYEGTLPTYVTDQPYFVGRKTEIDLLYDAWDGETRIYAIVAGGGTGKTTLVNHFLETLRKTGWRGAERVFVWSFYRQGTDINPRGSAEEFFDNALRFFGYLDGSLPRAPEQRGRELARLIGQHRSLVVLDGLETLQYPAPTVHAPHPGKLKDEGLKVLFAQLRTNKRGLCIVTSRYRIPNIREGISHVRAPDFFDLKLDDAIELLKSCGVHGSEEALADMVNKYNGHALSLTILANILKEHFSGDVRRIDEVDRWLVSRNEDSPGSIAWRVMRSYEIAFEQQLEDLGGSTPARLTQAAGRQLYLLRLMGLFSGPVSQSTLLHVARTNHPPLTSSETAVPVADWEKALQRLGEHRLVYVTSHRGERMVDTHPIVRQYLIERLRQPEFYAAARQAHQSLHRRFLAQLSEGDTGRNNSRMSIQAAAIEHACLGDLYDAAFQMYEVWYAGTGVGATEPREKYNPGHELDTLRNFFAVEWSDPIPQLNDRQKAIVLNAAAHSLRATGNIGSAAIAYGKATDTLHLVGEHGEAAVNEFQNSECLLLLGDLTSAGIAAQRAAAFSYGEGEDAIRRSRANTQVAYVKLLQGDVGGAVSGFAEPIEALADSVASETAFVGGSAYKFMEFLRVSHQLTRAQQLCEFLRTRREGRPQSLNLAFEYLAEARYQGETADYELALANCARAADCLINSELNYPLPLVNVHQAEFLWRLGRHDEARGWLNQAIDTAEYRSLRFVDLQAQLLDLKFRIATGEVQGSAALDALAVLKAEASNQGFDWMCWEQLLLECALKRQTGVSVDDAVQYFSALSQLGLPYYLAIISSTKSFH